MNPQPDEPTEAALRAVYALDADSVLRDKLTGSTRNRAEEAAHIIDRETNLPALLAELECAKRVIGTLRDHLVKGGSVEAIDPAKADLTTTSIVGLDFTGSKLAEAKAALAKSERDAQALWDVHTMLREAEAALANATKAGDRLNREAGEYAAQLAQAEAANKRLVEEAAIVREELKLEEDAFRSMEACYNRAIECLATERAAHESTKRELATAWREANSCHAVTLADADRLAAKERTIAELAQTWRPIETAPKDGTEIIGFRHDCGCVLIRWISPINFLTEREIEKLNEDDAETPDWFYADFVEGGRMSNDGLPTHWQPLPPAPSGPTKGEQP